MSEAWRPGIARAMRPAKEMHLFTRQPEGITSPCCLLIWLDTSSSRSSFGGGMESVYTVHCVKSSKFTKVSWFLRPGTDWIYHLLRDGRPPEPGRRGGVAPGHDEPEGGVWVEGRRAQKDHLWYTECVSTAWTAHLTEACAQTKAKFSSDRGEIEDHCVHWKGYSVTFLPYCAVVHLWTFLFVCCFCCRHFTQKTSPFSWVYQDSPSTSPPSVFPIPTRLPLPGQAQLFPLLQMAQLHSS